jgi:hypothetical protein
MASSRRHPTDRRPKASSKKPRRLNLSCRHSACSRHPSCRKNRMSLTTRSGDLACLRACWMTMTAVRSRPSGTQKSRR